MNAYFNLNSFQNVLAHAEKGDIGFNCTLTETCRVNRILVQSMGPRGTVASYRIT